MSSLERAEILIDMHFSDLSTQATLRSRTEKAAQRLQGVCLDPLNSVYYDCVNSVK